MYIDYCNSRFMLMMLVCVGLKKLGTAADDIVAEYSKTLASAIKNCNGRYYTSKEYLLLVFDQGLRFIRFLLQNLIIRNWISNLEVYEIWLILGQLL